MYDDLSHFLYNQMILASLDGLDGKHFNVFNVFHWVFLVIGIAAAAALVWLFILHNKYRSLVILLAAQSRAAAQMVRTPMPKLLQYGRSSPPTSNDVQMKTVREYLADIFPNRSFADGYFTGDTNLYDLSLCVQTCQEVQERPY